MKNLQRFLIKSICLLFFTALISLKLTAQVYIGNGTNVYLASGENVSFSGNIHLEDASLLSIASGSNAYFLGPITVTSNDINVTGNFIFGNTVNQTLSNFNLTVNDLTIGANLTVNPAKKLTVNGTLFNTSGISGLTIKSDSSGTGSLLHTTANIAATVERYIPYTNSGEFHMLGSPVASQAISSVYTAANGLYLWNEPTSLWIEYADGDFVSLNGGTSNFIPGRGYAVSYPTAVTKVFSGNLNQGTINFALLYSASGVCKSWNYLSNPYPSAINWDASSGWSRGTLANASGNSSTIWIWNEAAQQYGTYINNSGTLLFGVSNYIAEGQGFWVKASSAGTLSMNDAVRVHNTSQAFLKSSVILPSSLNVKVNCEGNNYKDELIIMYDKPSGIGGAEKIFSPAAFVPSLYTIKSNENWMINYLTNTDEFPIVPVGFKAGLNGNYSLTFSGTENFDILFLEDLKTGIIKNIISDHTDYQFSALIGENANRFLLHLKEKNAVAVNESKIQKPKVYFNNDDLIIENPFSGSSFIQIFDISGRIIKSLYSNNNIQIINLNINQGVYIIRILNNKNEFKTKIVKL